MLFVTSNGKETARWLLPVDLLNTGDATVLQSRVYSCHLQTSVAVSQVTSRVFVNYKFVKKEVSIMTPFPKRKWKKTTHTPFHATRGQQEAITSGALDVQDTLKGILHSRLPDKIRYVAYDAAQSALAIFRGESCKLCGNPVDGMHFAVRCGGRDMVQKYFGSLLSRFGDIDVWILVSFIVWRVQCFLKHTPIHKLTIAEFSKKCMLDLFALLRDNRLETTRALLGLWEELTATSRAEILSTEFLTE